MEFYPSLDRVTLKNYVKQQLQSFFPDGEQIAWATLQILVDDALDRVKFCFSHIKNKNYCSDDGVRFSHTFSDQYCTFLYFMSNEAYKRGFESLYNKISVLNRYLHGIDLFGHVEMPRIFLLVHPIGTIIGRARFDDYLTIYQGVTIGGIHSDSGILYPEFGTGVSLFARSMVLGKCKVGDNVTFGANSFLLNTTVPENKIVLGSHPAIKMIENKKLNIEMIYSKAK